MIVWKEKIPWTYENSGELNYNSPELAVTYDNFFYSRIAEETETDTFRMVDSGVRGIDYIVKDDIVIAEDGYYTYGKFVTDSFHVNETKFEKDIDIKKNEPIKVSDKYLRIVDKITREAFFLKDRNKRDIDIENKDNFKIIEVKFDKDVDIKKNESIKVNEKSLRDFDRDTKLDKFSVGDPLYYDEYENEDGEIIENNRQDNVVSDLTLFDFEIISRPLLSKPNTNTEESEDNFEDYVKENAPLGYSELRPFYPGEYEYKDAVVGFTLSISPTNGRFGVIGSKVYADVEDVVEKGTTEVNGDGLTEIVFTKRFYTIPHIQAVVVWAQGNIATNVEVREITRTGFKVGIRSLETTQLVSGEISWLADGY